MTRQAELRVRPPDERGGVEGRRRQRPAPDVRRAVLARLPGYRLSKFQDCLPERFALEVIESCLLDVAGAVRWLGE